jgi:hypothetical protein
VCRTPQASARSSRRWPALAHRTSFSTVIAARLLERGGCDAKHTRNVYNTARGCNDLPSPKVGLVAAHVEASPGLTSPPSRTVGDGIPGCSSSYPGAPFQLRALEFTGRTGKRGLPNARGNVPPQEANTRASDVVAPFPAINGASSEGARESHEAAHVRWEDVCEL